MWVVAQATPVTCLVECAPLQTRAGLYCSSFDKGKLAFGGLAAAGGGLPMLMLHVTRAPPDLPAATSNSDCPASSLVAVRFDSNIDLTYLMSHCCESPTSSFLAK